MAKTISLVLGSGGARGYAHIGIIEEVLSRGYEIKAIAGTSMGALIGGAYASGTLETYKEWILGLKYFDIIRLLDLSFTSLGGLLAGDRIIKVLTDMLGNQNIEDLPIPYTAVATDLDARKEIWFQDGSLLQAIRASIAIPMLFTPLYYQNRLLVDGGVLNPVPIAPTISAHTDLILAVDLNSNIPPLEMVTTRSIESDIKEHKIFERWFNKYSKGKEKTVSTKPGSFDILSQTVEVMQDVLTRYQMATHRPDIVVPVSANQCRFFEFHKAAEIIQVGRLQASTALNTFDAYNRSTSD